MKSILDPSFRYTSSFNTDLQKTFARIRRDNQKDADTATPATVNTLAKLSSIVRKSAAAYSPVSNHTGDALNVR
jgi:hypothetical protein